MAHRRWLRDHGWVLVVGSLVGVAGTWTFAVKPANPNTVLVYSDSTHKLAYKCVCIRGTGGDWGWTPIPVGTNPLPAAQDLCPAQFVGTCPPT